MPSLSLALAVLERLLFLPDERPHAGRALLQPVWVVTGLVSGELGFEVLGDDVQVVQRHVGELLPGRNLEATRTNVAVGLPSEPSFAELGHVHSLAEPLRRPELGEGD